ncbi:MAG: DMT family transporter [Caldilineales bacterium]|nr:DMT family transporter [Caldilineales bacterium]
MNRKDAAIFLALSAIWGSSFLFIKLGLLGGFQPISLVTMRLLFGSTVMYLLMRRRGHTFAAARPFFASIAFLGFINNVVPFSLITWGEQYIDSGMASILNSIVPLFAVMLSHVALADERLTARRVAGVTLGFLGVLILFAPDLVFGSSPYRLAGQLAIVLASLSYAIGSVFARKRLIGIPAPVLTTTQLGFAFLWALVPAIVLEQPWQLNLTPMAWFSVLWLGVLGTGLAYLLFFTLIRNIGATPTTMVTYVIPVFAVTFGVIFLNESLHWTQFAAMALIFAGVWMVNRRK